MRHGHGASEIVQGQLHDRRAQIAAIAFDPHMASFEGNVGYNQDDATGFIKLNALRLRLRKKRNR